MGTKPQTPTGLKVSKHQGPTVAMLGARAQYPVVVQQPVTHPQGGGVGPIHVP